MNHRLAGIPGSAAKRNPFRRYAIEPERSVRKIEVIGDSTLEMLKAIWNAYLSRAEESRDNARTNGTYIPAWWTASQIIGGHRYSSVDVERFTIALAGFQDDKYFKVIAGPFLSKLVDLGKDPDYVIHTSHLPRMDGLGNAQGNVASERYPSLKRIVIKGDVGDGLGLEMASGSITVLGNARNKAGQCMTGGSIVVEGNTGDSCGHGMAGGSILVHGNVEEQLGIIMQGGIIRVMGNAGNHVGWGMRGGEIHIEGDIRSISDRTRHGRIYHKGVLIVDK